MFDNLQKAPICKPERKHVNKGHNRANCYVCDLNICGACAKANNAKIPR